MIDDDSHNDDSPPPPSSAAGPGTGDALIRLSFAEARVLGCLLEKEATTPDYYPLTLNQLQAACNQSSNREPVSAFDTAEVEEAMEGLRYKHLAILVHQAGARVAKNKHTLDRVFPYLTEGERALLCVLLLRGQQTAGELRQRTERIHTFHDIESTEATLQRLCTYDPHPLVKELPAGGGRRVPTFVHLFCGEPAADLFSTAASVPIVSRGAETIAGPSWREEMERQISELRGTVEELRAEVGRLKDELGG